jgi:UDP-3-O-[3-hydroxymyristoyl] N-acetylglucosamine deacetylase
MGIIERHTLHGETSDLRQSENSPVRQKTLKSSIDCTGIALHSGRKVRMTLMPAEPDSGIVFVRADAGCKVVPARWDRVVDTRLCTVIGDESGVTVGTVEHLMAAFAGLGIDNAVVALDGPEVPVMDGSSEPFVFLIECAGIQVQDAPKRCLRIVKPVSYEDDRCSVSLRPDSGFSVSYELDYEARGVRRQQIALGLVNGTFKKELSRARTFGFLQDVEKLRSLGLGRGGSLENAIVIDDGRVLNPEGLRYDNELVRHKTLDAVGDLYLAGAPIVGRFEGRYSGHAANNLLLRTLFADASAWTLDVLTEAEEEEAHQLWRGDVAMVANA